MQREIRITREELYELIWDRAVSKVAPELGISDVALRKKCRSLEIPVPGSQYWGRKNAGKPARKTPLGPAPEGVDRPIVFWPDAKKPSTEVAKAIEEARALKPKPISTARRDTTVVRTLAALKKQAQDLHGGVKVSSPDMFEVRAHPDTLDRVGSFLDLLVSSAKARGLSIRSGRNSLGFDVDGEVISFNVSQVIRRVPHEPTDEEIARRDRWDKKHKNDWDRWFDRPQIPQYDFLPTGAMSIEIGGWPRPNGVTHKFADTRARKIDERVDDILVSFAAHAANLKVHNVNEERRELEGIRAQQAERERRRLAALEEERVKYLQGKLADFSEARVLRHFLSDVGGVANGNDSAFLNWAKARLQALEEATSYQAIDGETRAHEAFGKDAFDEAWDDMHRGN